MSSASLLWPKFTRKRNHSKYNFRRLIFSATGAVLRSIGFCSQIMDSKAKESIEDPDNIEILENLSKDLKQISQSFHDMQVRAAILNVEIGILFDPEAVKAVKESQETCIKCSQRMNEVIERPIDLLVNEDVRMDG